MAQNIYLVFLTVLCLIGGAQLQQLVTGPQNDTAVINGTLNLTCRFSEPVACAWQRNRESVSIRSRYNYVNPLAATENVADCSIVIRSVQQADVASWLCQSLATDSTQAVSSDPAFLSIRKTPSNPTVVMNGRQIYELNVVDTPENLCCGAHNGNPPAKLLWEVDNIPYRGLPPTIRQVSDNIYDSELCWNLQNDWERLQNARSVRCIGSHPGYSGQNALIDIAVKKNEATTFAHLTHANGSYLEGNVTVNAGSSLTFHCNANGHPKPLYKWEFKNPAEETWNLYNDAQNVTLSREGVYRCVARNFPDENLIYSPVITINPPSTETGNMGMITGIIIGVLALLAIFIIAFVVYWRKRKSGSHITESSSNAEKGGQDEQEAEKLTKVAPNTEECVYENVKQNDKEDEINGKIESSPLKTNHNEDKKPVEVVYAQLDLSAPKNVKPKTGTPEYEKTEYAELNFNNAQNNAAPPVSTPAVISTTVAPAVNATPVVAPTSTIKEES